MFTTGQKVVCIDDKFHPGVLKYYTALPVKDVVYEVRGTTVGISPGGVEGEICVYLVGIVNPCSEVAPFMERGFKAERFAPLETTEETETSYEYTPQEVEVEKEETVPA